MRELRKGDVLKKGDKLIFIDSHTRIKHGSEVTVSYRVTIDSDKTIVCVGKTTVYNLYAYKFRLPNGSIDELDIF